MAEIDVVVIGGGQSGQDIVGDLSSNGIRTAVISPENARPEWLPESIDWVCGRGAVINQHLVVALDPETADERRLIPCKCIVIATGRLDPARGSQRLLGITKLGAQYTADQSQVITDERGQTRAPGIFVAGQCASGGGVGISTILDHLVDQSTLEVRADA